MGEQAGQATPCQFRDLHREFAELEKELRAWEQERNDESRSKLQRRLNWICDGLDGLAFLCPSFHALYLSLVDRACRVVEPRLVHDVPVWKMWQKFHAKALRRAVPPVLGPIPGGMLRGWVDIARAHERYDLRVCIDGLRQLLKDSACGGQSPLAGSDHLHTALTQSLESTERMTQGREREQQTAALLGLLGEVCLSDRSMAAGLAGRAAELVLSSEGLADFSELTQFLMALKIEPGGPEQGAPCFDTMRGLFESVRARIDDRFWALPEKRPEIQGIQQQLVPYLEGRRPGASRNRVEGGNCEVRVRVRRLDAAGRRAEAIVWEGELKNATTDGETLVVEVPTTDWQFAVGQYTDDDQLGGKRAIVVAERVQGEGAGTAVHFSEVAVSVDPPAWQRAALFPAVEREAAVRRAWVYDKQHDPHEGNGLALQLTEPPGKSFVALLGRLPPLPLGDTSSRPSKGYQGRLRGHTAGPDVPESELALLNLAVRALRQVSLQLGSRNCRRALWKKAGAKGPSEPEVADYCHHLLKPFVEQRGATLTRTENANGEPDFVLKRGEARVVIELKLARKDNYRSLRKGLMEQLPEYLRGRGVGILWVVELFPQARALQRNLRTLARERDDLPRDENRLDLFLTSFGKPGKPPSQGASGEHPPRYLPHLAQGEP